MIVASTPPPAIIVQAERFDVLRCRCPECLRLDALYPNEGYQLALFAYRPSVRGKAPS